VVKKLVKNNTMSDNVKPLNSKSIINKVKLKQNNSDTDMVATEIKSRLNILKNENHDKMQNKGMHNINCIYQSVEKISECRSIELKSNNNSHINQLGIKIFIIINLKIEKYINLIFFQIRKKELHR
jgi:hypothetical protein